jgi:hypothetical protein
MAIDESAILDALLSEARHLRRHSGAGRNPVAMNRVVASRPISSFATIKFCRHWMTSFAVMKRFRPAPE